MHIFGLSFLLFYLNISDGTGYWSQLRRSDSPTYERAVKLQRTKKKLVRCELAIKFLAKCRDTNVFPKFTSRRNANRKDPRTRNKYRRKILLDELRKKHQEARKLRDTIKPEEIALFQDMTYIKKSILRWSIQRLNEAERLLVQKRHD